MLSLTKYRLLAATSILISLSLLAPQESIAAAKAGTKCLKIGQTATVANKKFTCIKSGKNLVWNKGVLVPIKATPVQSPSATPKPTSTPTPTPNLLEETIIKNTIVAKMADVSMYETFYEMKNIKFIVPILAFSLFSCNDYLDINETTNNLEFDQVTPRQLLPGAEVTTFRVQVTTMNQLGNVFMNSWTRNVQSYGNGFDNELQLNMSNAFYSGIWDGLYRNLKNFDAIIKFASCS